MFHRGRFLLIGTGCAAALAAMLLIPGGEQVAVADTSGTVTLDSSQETIAAIDAMLGPAEVAAAAPQAPVKRTISEADRNLMTAALEQPQTDLEGAPLVDPNLRADTIGPSAVNLRAGPSTDTATIGVLDPGQAVQTGESDGGWVEVTLPDGTTGWVYSRYLASEIKATAAASPEPSAQTATDSGSTKAVIKGKGSSGKLAGRTARIDSALIARSKPNGNALFRTEPGERVKIVDQRGNWLRIVTADGSSGWIQAG